MVDTTERNIDRTISDSPIFAAVYVDQLLIYAHSNNILKKVFLIYLFV